MGKWDTFGGIPGIVFPDGNKWTKVRASRPRSEPHVAEPVPGRSTLSHVFFIAVVLIAIVPLLFRLARFTYPFLAQVAAGTPKRRPPNVTLKTVD